MCIFESPRLLALFNNTRTDETALYNLNKVVYAYVLHIDGFSRAWRIFWALLESHRTLESAVTCVFLSGCNQMFAQMFISEDTALLHFCRKETVTSECYLVYLWNKNYFTRYRTAILLSYVTRQYVQQFAPYIIFIILKEAKWHHFWRSWDISATKGCFATIFYHFSCFN